MRGGPNRSTIRNRKSYVGVGVPRPLFHTSLINDSFGDPGLYVEFMFEKRAILFDMGDLSALSPRKLLRVSHVFVSHRHMDHFSGFDHLLRVCLGREKDLHIFGPEGIIEGVGHKLAAYSWNLVRNYSTDFTLIVDELAEPDKTRRVEFHCKKGFEPESEQTFAIDDGILLDEDALRVRVAILDHALPCLGFALEEKAHVNVWKNRVEEMGFRVGPWLRELKQAILGSAPDTKPFRVCWDDETGAHEKTVPLGILKKELTETVAGQKIAYVVDVVYSPENTERIVKLAEGAETLFIESPFLERDADIASKKFHLTAHQAGVLGKKAGAERLVTFHYSPRYSDQESDIREEAMEAFSGDG